MTITLLALRPRIETLSLLYHIQANHHPIAATCPEIAATSGMHRMSLLHRLRRFASAGWLTTAQRPDYSTKRGKFEVTEFTLSEAGLKLLKDSEHREQEYRILEPKENGYKEPLHKPGLTKGFAGVASIFHTGAGI